MTPDVTQPVTPTHRPVPRKLTQGMITALSLAIARGNYPCTACRLVDIDYNTYIRWIELGQADAAQGIDSIYSRLFISLKRAEAEAEAELVAVVRDVATVDRNWIAGMTFLERRHPDRWGRKDRTEVSIKETRQIQITRVEMVAPQLPEPEVEGEYKEIT